MTRAEHVRTVAEQRRLLRSYEAELTRLVAEAQEWLDRLRVLEANADRLELRRDRHTGT